MGKGKCHNWHMRSGILPPSLKLRRTSPRAVILMLAIVFALAGVGGSWGTKVALAETVEELREKLNQRKETLKSAEERIQQFRAEIQIKKKEARTLADQIEILEDNVAALELEIAKTVAEIDAIQAEIDGVQEEINEKEAEIGHQKSLLGKYIRALHDLDQQSGVTVFLKYETFSEAIHEAATIEELQNRAQETLAAIQRLRDELEAKRRDLEDFKETLEALRSRQEHQQQTLTVQRSSKQRILELTNAQEAKYQSLLKEAQAAHQAAETEIRKLDAAIREELRRQGIGNLPRVGVMDWPIEPIFGVSCEFRCAGYPYEYLIGPHAAIDIPTYMGTPVKAPADGYVARVHDSGNSNYSYLLILHGDDVSTVYGHLSGFAVNEGETVTRGQVIGYTGGAAGSRGAGLSTGPHLHFEVREKNVPVNPRRYLPRE